VIASIIAQIFGMPFMNKLFKSSFDLFSLRKIKLSQNDFKQHSKILQFHVFQEKEQIPLIEVLNSILLVKI
jgi:hypothetical protein